ncbi:MAG: hypothetical protein KJP21_08655, partial [Bacteroidia bacterium]|nr:hypothetical protein [Bacteroidia bacterium]
MRSELILYCLIMLVSFEAAAQQKFEFDGQVSTVASYNPDNSLDLLVAGRYIPELNYEIQLDSNRLFDIELSSNISGSLSSLPFDTFTHTSKISPYRMWARYSGSQFELRAGLQKIDFGSATLLRPLQWFNEIDPRDPLQLTNGVYGLLGKYYFLNNTNIWVWGLYGNENQRGFDALPSNQNAPEFGGRIQKSTPKGEIALSYHNRKADASEFLMNSDYSSISENKIAFDGRWDNVVG